MGKIILTTERLLLRFQNYSDIQYLISLWSDEEVTRYLGGAREKTYLNNEFTNVADNPEKEKYDLWPMVLKETKELIGHAGLLDKEVEEKKYIEIAFIVGKDKWGNGYGTEIAAALMHYAFFTLNLDEIIAIIEHGNIKSKHIVTKIGMSFWKSMKKNGKEKEIFIKRKQLQHIQKKVP